MFKFCDVLHELEQKNANKLLKERSTEWKSHLTFEENFPFLYFIMSLISISQADATT